MFESMVDTKILYWREIKTPAHPWHCRDSPKVKSWHLSPAMSLLSPTLGGPEIQMTGAVLKQSVIMHQENKSLINILMVMCMEIKTFLISF